MRYEIRRPAAVSAIVALAVIIAFCPAWMCAQPEITTAHSCCPRSQHKQDVPPCDASTQTCPYLLLQKAKSVPPPLAVPPLETTAIAVQMEYYGQITIAPTYILDLQDLYLRNRVLLI
jgi:hypothetical protein